MEILVTGATGFLAHSLIPALQDRGHSVRGLVLPTEDATWLHKQRVTVYTGDVTKPSTLSEPMRGADAVVHMAALMATWAPMHVHYAVHVTGTENVCKAALAAGTRRFVHLSSAITYTPGQGRPIREDSPQVPLHEPHAVTKAQGDKLVQRMIVANGLPAVIIRPEAMFGPYDRINFRRLADRLRAGKGIIIGSGRNAVPFVYVTDVVEGLLLALEHPSAVGQAYNITNDHTMTEKEFLEAIAEEVDGKPPRIHVPYRAMYGAATAAEWVATITKREPLATRHGVQMFGSHNPLSIEKARRELGYEPQVPLRDGIRLAGAWYRTNVFGSVGAASAAPVLFLTRRTGLEAGRNRRFGMQTQQRLDRHGQREPKMPVQQEMAGEVAIITGASTGIGAATAREFARRGARVVLAARSAGELEAQARSITESGGEALAVPADISDASQVEQLVAGVYDAFGRVDVLVNNAGIGWTKLLVNSSPDEIRQVVDINLTGAILMSRAVLPRMLERGQGTIINVSSVCGRVAVEPLYSATKYGIRGFSLSLRRQLATSNVSVSLVSPGNIRTRMTKDINEPMTEPEVVADAIAKLVRQPRREVVVPRKHNLVIWLEQGSPALADLAYRWRHRHGLRAK